MAELADAYDSKSYGKPCRFESGYRHKAEDFILGFFVFCENCCLCCLFMFVAGLKAKHLLASKLAQMFGFSTLVSFHVREAFDGFGEVGDGFVGVAVGDSIADAVFDVAF